MSDELLNYIIRFFYMFVLTLSIMILFTEATCIALLVMDTQTRERTSLSIAEAFKQCLSSHALVLIISF